MALNRIFLAALLGAALSAQAQTHRIEYTWPGQPCGDILSCDVGCSACNLPAASDPMLIGTNVAWLGVATCPMPVVPGDNAVVTSGWTAEPDAGHAVIINGLTTQPMRIDTIRFRHALYQDGPQRLKVLFTNDVSRPLEEVADLAVPAYLSDEVLIGLGQVAAPEGNPFGAFQLRLQPYHGGSGSWILDELVITASPVQDAQTGIVDPYVRRTASSGPLHDVMGRLAGQELAPGLYLGQGRRVVVVE